MEEQHMNPDFPKQRGCFITPKDAAYEDACKVVDYPTWSLKNGREPLCSNPGIEAGVDFEKSFASKREALEFCAAERYVVCAHPKTDEELAAARAKREAYYASHSANAAQDELEF